MTTEKYWNIMMILLLAIVTICLVGSLVVSFDIVKFSYLIILYVFVFIMHRQMKK